MIHISGFLKVTPKDGGILQSSISAKCVAIPADLPKNFRVLGLVAECHLIKSPVIMELRIHYKNFSVTTTLDMKITSIDIG